MLVPIVDCADDPPVVVDLTQESEAGKSFASLGLGLFLLLYL
jgi:hypothetical protein